MNGSETEELYLAFDLLFAAGYFKAIMDETDADYEAGRVLDSIY